MEQFLIKIASEEPAKLQQRLEFLEARLKCLETMRPPRPFEDDYHSHFEDVEATRSKIDAVRRRLDS